MSEEIQMDSIFDSVKTTLKEYKYEILFGLIIICLLNVFFTRNSSNSNLNDKQKKFLTTLTDMADILEENNINYFLFAGTALGCHREKKFIEHDNDIDLGSNSLQFKNLYVNGTTFTDALGFGTTVMTLPTADGDADQILKTDGSGNIGFATSSGIGMGKAIAAALVFG